MKKLTERMMKRAQQTQYTYTNGSPFGQSNPFGNTQYQEHTSAKKEGKIQVDYIPPQEEHRKGAATAGEFVDFEEVK